MKWNLVLVLIILLILIVPLTYAGGGDYLDYVTIGQGDNRWCRLIGCTVIDLIVDSLTVYNLSVIGQVFNVTMIRVNWTITESFNVGGDLIAKNATFDNLNVTGKVDITYSLDDAYDDGSVIQVNKTNITIDLHVLGDPVTPDRAITFELGGNSYIQISPSGFFSNLLSEGFKVAHPTVPDAIFVKLTIVDEDTPQLYGTPNLELYSSGIIQVQTNMVMGYSSNISMTGYLTDGTNSLTVANARTAYDFTTNGSFQYTLQNSSNITCIGNQCYYNGSVGAGNGVADGMGNHTAFQDLNMSDYNITSVSSVIGKNESGMEFKNGGGIKFWLYD